MANVPPAADPDDPDDPEDPEDPVGSPSALELKLHEKMSTRTRTRNSWPMRSVASTESVRQGCVYTVCTDRRVHVVPSVVVQIESEP